MRIANRGEDWVALSSQLGVKYKTANAWIRSGELAGLGKSGPKPKKMKLDHETKLLEWIEQYPQLTFKQLQAKLLN